MISTSIVNALSQLFSVKVEYMSVIVHNKAKVFIIVASTSLIVLKDDFETLTAKFSFMCIDRMIISSKDQFLFQLHMNTKRPNNVPAKMNIHCLERRTLIKFIRYGWKTDYMYKYLEVRELPTYKAPFKDYNYQVDMLKPPQVELLELQESQKFGKHTHLKYSMFLPSTYSNTQLGVYVNSKFKSKFTLQVSETLPLEVLKYIGERIDLQYYAESYMNTVLEGRHHWIIESSLYRKRKNLYNDMAEWTAWQVHGRTKEQDIICIILRRKYQPPLMENFTDIILTFYGPHGFTNMMDQRGEQEEDQMNELEPEEEQEEGEEGEEGEDEHKKNPGEAYKEALMTVYNEQFVQNLVREVADTIYYSELCPLEACYISFVKFMVNNLIYDEDCIRFLDQRMGIMSKFQVLANNLINMLQSMIKLKSNQEGKTDAPTVKFINDFIIALKIEDPDVKRNFTYKLSRYLAAQLDGGLYSDFTFNLIVDELYATNRSEILTLFDFFLYAVSESTGTQNDFLCEEIQKKLNKVVQQKYVYNDRVMSSLLISNLFIEELLKKDQNQQLYIDLIVYLLLNGKSCRQSACKHIISYQIQGKEQMNEQLVNLLKGLVSPLLIVYQSDYVALSTLACVALLNMCANSKDFKYMIMKENGLDLFVNQLDSINQNQLHFTLKIIYSMMSIVQNIETLINLKIIERIQKIMKGNHSINGAYYSAQSQTMCCKILNKCINPDNDHKEELDTLIEIIVRHSDEYYLDIELIDLLKAEAINTIFRILSMNESDEEIMERIQMNLMPYVVSIVQQNIQDTLKFSVVRLMCIIVKNQKEFAKEWLKGEKFLESIEAFEKHNIPGADYLMQQLT